MSVTTLPAVGLLERAVGYTRGALGRVRPTDLGRPTPCPGWDLGRLLRHMDDGLDAFAQASRGYVDLAPTPVGGPLLDRLRTRACTLLGAWVGDAASQSETVTVGDRTLPSDVLLAAGALEIALHGWDVARSTGHPVPLPDDLARRLLPAAGLLIDRTDRPDRFGPPRPVGPDASDADRLVAFSGRWPEAGAG